jgi:hypothetical protein
VQDLETKNEYTLCAKNTIYRAESDFACKCLVTLEKGNIITIYSLTGDTISLEETVDTLKKHILPKTDNYISAQLAWHPLLSFCPWSHNEL